MSGVMLGAALLLGGAWLIQQRMAADQVAMGRALFAGEQALVGRLPGHDTALPSVATRCVNCHEAPNPAPTAADSNGVRVAGPAPDAQAEGSYAPALNRQALLGRQGRRGGPPSSYDLDTLCVLLRRGVDPALVVVSTTMPRFELNDEQCRALWRYLTSR
jgi:hypothetical protein